MKPNNAMTAEHWEGLITELNAGKSLFGGERERMWNDATDRAISIVRKYRDGVGLFQLVGDKNAK